MQYEKGSIGRVFAVRIDHGEDLLSELSKLARNEGIESAFFVLLGAASDAELVIGPKEKSVPPETVWTSFDDAREMIGVGNIVRENGEPRIHLHASAGNSSGMLMGCIRKRAKAFMVLEVMVLELAGFSASREYNEKIGFWPFTFR